MTQFFLPPFFIVAGKPGSIILKKSSIALKAHMIIFADILDIISLHVNPISLCLGSEKKTLQ